MEAKKKRTSEVSVIPTETILYIGIDPDVDKNGVAYLNKARKQLEVTSRTLPNLLHYLQFIKERAEADSTPYIVVIEASWFLSANWHLSSSVTKRQAAQIGHNTGRNHQVGITIAEYCDYHNIPYYCAMPLRKSWSGPHGKITHRELQSFSWLTDNRTNQEERDAALLAWVHARLPIKIKVCER